MIIFNVSFTALLVNAKMPCWDRNKGRYYVCRCFFLIITVGVRMNEIITKVTIIAEECFMPSFALVYDNDLIRGP